MKDVSDYLPRWTKKVITEGGGRDPLGLSRVTFMLTDSLLTGIITTTDRARYYSFYTWVLWHIEQEEDSTQYDKFVEAFRRREGVMALATLASAPELSPVGVEVVRGYLDRGRQSDEYSCDFKVLPSNNMGGYGQYYGGSLYQLKLTHRDENAIDRVTVDFGTELAIAFDGSIRATKYITEKKYLQNKVSTSDLEELQECFTLDSIKKDLAGNERAKLTEVFFASDENYKDDKSILRRQSLTILLHLISEYGKHDSFPNTQNSEALDEYLLYAIYYDVLWVSDEKLAKFEKLKEHDFCYELWKQFCLHQFITQALEHLLYAVIETVGYDATGLTLPECIEEMTQPSFFSALEAITGSNCPRPRDLLAVFDVTDIPNDQFSLKAQAMYLPIHSLSEAQILASPGRSPQEAASVTVAILAVLFAKWRGGFGDRTMSYVSQKAGQQLWAQRVMPHMDEWLDPTKTWNEVLSKLVEDFVLNQHDRIMYEKRRLDSSWLHRADGKIVKDQDYRPNWRASRFLNAVRIMSDLNLLETNESKEVMITEAGRKLVEQ